MAKTEICLNCASANIVKSGRVIRTGGMVQRYQCKECGTIMVDKRKDLDE